MELDEIDIALINELQLNPDIDIEELRDRINSKLNRKLSTSTIYHRRSKLLEKGILKKAYIPDYEKIGKPTLAFIAIKFDGHDDEMLRKLTEFPGVMEVHAVSGHYDVFLKVRTRNIEELANLVFRIRTENILVKSTEIFVNLRTEKETLLIEV